MQRQLTSPATTVETTAIVKAVLSADAVSATERLLGQGMTSKGPKSQNRHSWPTPPALQPRHPKISTSHCRQRRSRKQGSEGPAQVAAPSTRLHGNGGTGGGGGGGGDGETKIKCSATAFASNNGGLSGKLRADSRSLPSRPGSPLMPRSTPFESYPATVVVKAICNVRFVQSRSTCTWQSGAEQSNDRANAAAHSPRTVALYSCNTVVVFVQLALVITERMMRVCLMGASGGGL